MHKSWGSPHPSNDADLVVLIVDTYPQHKRAYENIPTYEKKHIPVMTRIGVRLTRSESWLHSAGARRTNGAVAATIITI